MTDRKVKILLDVISKVVEVKTKEPKLDITKTINRVAFLMKRDSAVINKMLRESNWVLVTMTCKK